MASEGKKFDGGKSPVMQSVLHYFPRALQAVGIVSKYGADKYSVPFSDKNWKRVDSAIGRYGDGLARHLMMESVEEYDAESSLLHAAHTAWNALARLELLLEAGKTVDQLSSLPANPVVPPESVPPLSGWIIGPGGWVKV